MNYFAIIVQYIPFKSLCFMMKMKYVFGLNIKRGSGLGEAGGRKHGLAFNERREAIKFEAVNFKKRALM